MKRIIIVKKTDPGCGPVYIVKVHDFSLPSNARFWYFVIITGTFLLWTYLYDEKRYRIILTTINDAEVYRFCSLIIRIRLKIKKIKQREKARKKQKSKKLKSTYYSVQQFFDSAPLKTNYLNSLTGPNQTFRDLKLKGFDENEIAQIMSTDAYKTGTKIF